MLKILDTDQDPNVDCGFTRLTARSERTQTQSTSSLAAGQIIPCKPRVIRYNINIIKKDIGTPAAQQVNFPDDSNTASLFALMTQNINDWILGNLSRQTLPSYTTYVNDSKIRLSLKGIYFHYDTAAWNSVDPNNPCTSAFYDQFGVNKGKEFNLFILGKSPGGGCGPSPYFLNMMGAEQPATTLSWAFTSIVPHEFGHCLGLRHTHEVAGGNDLISDTAPELVSGWISSNSTTTNNNLMGNQIDRSSLSYMQCHVMHWHLRTIASGLWEMKVAPPTPRAIANGHAHGVFAVEEFGDLMRAYWTNTPGTTPQIRWNFQTIPLADLRLVPGSLVSTNVIDSGRAYGVNDRYEIIRTNFANSALSVQILGGPGTTPGSLIVDSTASNLYGVDLNRLLFGIPAVGGGWIPIQSPTMAAGSLIATNWGSVQIFGVTEDYKVVHVGGAGTVTVAVAGITAVPGSLVDSGNFGLFGVDEHNNLVHVNAVFAGSVHTVSIPGSELHAGSLAWQSVSNELYGVATDGRLVRLFANSTFATSLLAIPPVVPGSIVDGVSNGLFGVTPSGDILQITPSGTGSSQTVQRSGARVIPGSLISDSAEGGDGGRVFGVNETGQIVGTWKSGSVHNYGIAE